MPDEAKKAVRGRPVTGKAKSSTERSKAADEALVASGGRIMRARLSPDSAASLAILKAALGSDKNALDAALNFAAKNIDIIVGTNVN